MKTADCVNWIIANVDPSSKKSDWKRRSKKDYGNVVIRMFENVSTNQTVYVKEENGELSNAGKTPISSIKFANTGMGTGRVIYSRDEDNDYEIDGVGGLFFFCGPEIIRGTRRCLEDSLTGGTEITLSELFKDFQIDIGAQENGHIIYPPKGMNNKKKFWEIVEKRLKDAGAVDMGW